MRVLLVDDDKQTHDSFEQAAKTSCEGCSLTSVYTSAEAEEMMGKLEFDVVISGLGTKASDSQPLLAKVRKDTPAAMRVAIAQKSERDAVMDSEWLVHQFLLKPCDTATLKETINKICAFHGFLKNDSLRKVAAELKTLPSFPALYFQLMDELKSPNSSVQRAAKIISKDVGMTAKIIKMVNSPFFGFTQHISDVAQAIALLGIDTIQALAISSHIFSRYPQAKVKGFKLDRLWSHSIAVGVCAKEIAKAAKLDKDGQNAAFVSGILHDVGQIVLAANVAEDYEKAIAMANEDGVTLPVAELLTLGANHAQVGGYLLAMWGLPNEIIESVVFHHTPSKNRIENKASLAYVHVADVFVDMETHQDHIGAPGKIDDEYIASIGAQDQVEQWFEVCREIKDRAS